MIDPDHSPLDDIDETEEERALADAEAAIAAGRVIGHDSMMKWLASWANALGHGVTSTQ